MHSMAYGGSKDHHHSHNDYLKKVTNSKDVNTTPKGNKNLRLKGVDISPSLQAIETTSNISKDIHCLDDTHKDESKNVGSNEMSFHPYKQDSRTRKKEEKTQEIRNAQSQEMICGLKGSRLHKNYSSDGESKQNKIEGMMRPVTSSSRRSLPNCPQKQHKSDYPHQEQVEKENHHGEETIKSKSQLEDAKSIITELSISNENPKNLSQQHESCDDGDGGGYDNRPMSQSRKSQLRSKSRSRSRARSKSRSRSRSSSKSRSSSRSRSKSRSSTTSRSTSLSNDSGCYDQSQFSTMNDHTPYLAKWRCFGRRPPTIDEFRPMGETRLKNVRPAGKACYMLKHSDTFRKCPQQQTSDLWDNSPRLAKPIAGHWTMPLPYETKVTQVGKINPHFTPSRGDLIIINPAQNSYKAMKSGFVMTYRGSSYSFGVGDLIVRLGRFLPSQKYIPYGNLELFMSTYNGQMRFLGHQPILLVDFNYHNLDYESPGKYLRVGTFLTETFFPRRGDIVILGDAWASDPNFQRKNHSLVKYWRPKMEFLPNDMLLRPYVDIGRSIKGGKIRFYWGAVELYSYSGKGLAWVYWGRDHHICDTPYIFEEQHGT